MYVCNFSGKNASLSFYILHINSTDSNIYCNIKELKSIDKNIKNASLLKFNFFGLYG